ncbi:MAG: hypothetical protein WBG90_18485 [Saonia sp.]
MKKLIPYLFFAAAVILMLLASSCGSKKKLIDRINEKKVVLDNKDIAVTTRNDISVSSKIQDFEYVETYEPIDPTKPAIVEKENGRTKLTNAKLTKEKKHRAESKITNDNSRTDFKDESKTSDRSSKRTRSTDSNVKRVSPWPLLFGGITLLAAFFLWLRFGKRS